jgi:hypothetical protein
VQTVWVSQVSVSPLYPLPNLCFSQGFYVRLLFISYLGWLYAKPFPQVALAFDRLRKKDILSFEATLVRTNAHQKLKLLAARPSMLVRQLSELAKTVDTDTLVSELWALDPHSVPLPLLLNAYCALGDSRDRLVINKQGKPHTVGARQSIPGSDSLQVSLAAIMINQMRGSKEWQGLKIWSDPATHSLVLPLQVRKQSDGLLNLGRGSRIPLGNGPVLRLFMYWKQSAQTTDLDLSVMQLDQRFRYLSHVGWNNYGGGQDVAHSGDITSAPLGAAEFIDIRLSNFEEGYLLPAIVHFAGEAFTALDAAYAGWMHRHEVNADYAAFDAKTVVEKVNVNQNGKTWIPFMIDLAHRELVYVDLYSKGSRTVETNQHFPAMAKALSTFVQTKPTYGLLIDLLIVANGASYGKREEADITIGTDDTCTINVLELVGEKVLTLK